MTYAHESSHGIASILRQRFGRPAFYVLENRAFVLTEEPRTTLAAVAAAVPISLRGDVYHLYLRQMQSYWNNEPSYVLDEFVAYTNGSVCRRANRILNRRETERYATEFIVYASTMAMVSQTFDPQVKALIMWNSERFERDQAYLGVLRTSRDAWQLREFMRKYFGHQWCQKVIGL